MIKSNSLISRLIYKLLTNYNLFLKFNIVCVYSQLQCKCFVVCYYYYISNELFVMTVPHICSSVIFFRFLFARFRKWNLFNFVKPYTPHIVYRSVIKRERESISKTVYQVGYSFIKLYFSNIILTFWLLTLPTLYYLFHNLYKSWDE